MAITQQQINQNSQLEVGEYIGTLTPKGGVTIPVEVRRRLKVKPKDKVIFRVQEGKVELETLSKALSGWNRRNKAHKLFEEHYCSVSLAGPGRDFKQRQASSLAPAAARASHTLHQGRLGSPPGRRRFPQSPASAAVW